MRYNETIDYLYGLQIHGVKFGLDNVRLLLGRLGNPERAFKSVHVAGTNAKGSTCAMLAAMLTASGRKTGLFTSPHLVSFTERIKVGGAEITPDEVVGLAGEVRAAADAVGGEFSPTFFEVVTAMGFMHFARAGCEWAVVETGMGGRLDATNTLMPEATIITPVGLDHADFLGRTLAEVAREKAGIIKPGVRLVLGPQEPDAMGVIAATAAGRGAPVEMAGREFGTENVERTSDGIVFDYRSGARACEGLTVSLRGLYQAGNAGLALRVLEHLIPAGEFERAAREGLARAEWPGRLQLVADGPLTYIDGAHNPPAARALADEIAASGLLREMTLVTGVMADKDAAGIFRPLLPLCGEVFLTRPAYGRAEKPEALEAIVRKLGYAGPCHRTASVREAVEQARALGRPVLVTGSFYTIGEAMEALGAKGVFTDLRETMKPGEARA
jgi:dihydrofolate synthase/folylpolyglutamate synthase